MKTLKITAVVAILCSLVATLGCSGKPSGFPKVSPCTITVVNGSTPIEGVEVALIPDTPIAGVIAGGTTDSQGVCVVKTTFANFSAPGAPAGNFTVTLRKDPTPSKPELSAEEMSSMDRTDVDKYNKEREDEIKKMPKIIPPSLTSFQTSQVKLSTPNASELTVDISQY